MEEFRPKRKVRHCNPFGCRSEELDDLEAAVAGAGHIGDVPLLASEPNPPKAGR